MSTVELYFWVIYWIWTKHCQALCEDCLVCCSTPLYNRQWLKETYCKNETVNWALSRKWRQCGLKIRDIVFFFQLSFWSKTRIHLVLLTGAREIQGSDLNLNWTQNTRHIVTKGAFCNILLQGIESIYFWNSVGSPWCGILMADSLYW